MSGVTGVCVGHRGPASPGTVARVDGDSTMSSFLLSTPTLLPTTYCRGQCVRTAYVTERRIAVPVLMAAMLELAKSAIQAVSPLDVELIKFHRLTYSSH